MPGRFRGCFARVVQARNMEMGSLLPPPRVSPIWVRISILGPLIRVEWTAFGKLLFWRYFDGLSVETAGISGSEWRVEVVAGHRMGEGAGAGEERAGEMDGNRRVFWGVFQGGAPTGFFVPTFTTD